MALKPFRGRFLRIAHLSAWNLYWVILQNEYRKRFSYKGIGRLPDRPMPLSINLRFSPPHPTPPSWIGTITRAPSWNLLRKRKNTSSKISTSACVWKACIGCMCRRFPLRPCAKPLLTLSATGITAILKKSESPFLKTGWRYAIPANSSAD